MQSQRTLAIVSKALAPYRVRFYSEVAKALALEGWTVTLIVAMLGAKDHPWADPGADNQGLNIIGLRTIDDSFLQRCVNKVAHLIRMKDIEIPNTRLIRELDALNPDVVWTHEYSPFCLAAATWASMKDRHCLLSSDLGANPPPHSCTPFQLSVQKLMSFLYEGVIAHTKEATRRTHPAGAPINFAPHAIDTDEYYPCDKKQGKLFRFLFAGGVRSEKGILELIKAGELLAREGLQFEIRIVGTGPLDSWLYDQKQPWLSIAGFREKEALREEYRNADVYVLPTEGDTYGVTVHEAAASGLPLIVGRTAGAVETLVKEGITGHAINAKDVEELTQKMRAFVTSPAIARSMGQEARKYALLYDVKLLGKRTAGFIREIAYDSSQPLVSILERADPELASDWLQGKKIAAVFATMNRRDVACECIRLLASQDIPPNKVFIADNASSDGTSEAIAQMSADFPMEVAIIPLDENLGNAGGIQIAMNRAFDENFDSVWILDDDSWPDPGALAALLVKDGPHKVIRTSLILEPGSNRISWPFEIRDSNDKWRMMEATPVQTSKWREVHRSWLGALIPKDAYQKVGPVNADLFLRGEDEDYPRRLEQAGYKFWMNSSSILRHPIAGPLVTISLGDFKLCLERHLTADKLYYRIRNMLWIKREESGWAASTILACGYFLLLTCWFRPIGATLRVFGEAFRDALAGRLGKRPEV